MTQIQKTHTQKRKKNAKNITQMRSFLQNRKKGKQNHLRFAT